jgi:hypothetical protein
MIPEFGMVAGVLQSLLFWGFVAAIILVPRYLKSRERQRLYDTIRAAYEKGEAPSPEVLAGLAGVEKADLPPADRDLRRAIVLIAVGLGLVGVGAGLGYGLSFASETAGGIVGSIVAGAGAIPGFIGVAYLILWWLNGRARQA